MPDFFKTPPPVEYAFNQNSKNVHSGSADVCKTAKAVSFVSA